MYCVLCKDGETIATWMGLWDDGETIKAVCEKDSANPRFWGVWPIPNLEAIGNAMNEVAAETVRRAHAKRVHTRGARAHGPVARAVKPTQRPVSKVVEVVREGVKPVALPLPERLVGLWFMRREDGVKSARMTHDDVKELAEIINTDSESYAVNGSIIRGKFSYTMPGTQDRILVYRTSTRNYKEESRGE